MRSRLARELENFGETEERELAGAAGGLTFSGRGKNEMHASALTSEVDSREDMKRLYFRRLKRCSSAMNPLASLGF